MHKLLPRNMTSCSSRVLSNQSFWEVSVQHPLSFFPLLLSLLHPVPLHSSIWIAEKKKKSEQLTALSLSLSTQAENVMAIQPSMKYQVVLDYCIIPA